MIGVANKRKQIMTVTNKWCDQQKVKEYDSNQ